MMKKYKILTIVLAIMMSMTSCNDAIDIPPFDQLGEDNTFTNLDELQQGLNGVYSRYNLENEITFNSIFSDNTKPGFDNGGQLINLFNFVLPASEGNAAAIWNSHYSLINAANRVIEALPPLEPVSTDFENESDFQDALRIYNDIAAQLYALRAAAHLHLVNYYTTDYTDPSALSIIISDFVPETNETFARNTNQQVFQFIGDELDRAESLLGDGFTDNNLVTKSFITGLKARMALLQEDPMAITYADEVINNGGFSLASTVLYPLMFQDIDESEVIFNMVRTAGLVGGIWYFTNSDGPFIEASNGLHDAFDPDDVRLGVCINFSSDNGGPSDPANNIHLINKYPGSGGTPYLNNIKAMRLSEMYLIKAEIQAKVLQDGPATAATLKTLRDARFGFNTPLASYTTSVEALQDVMNERRLELAYEGHRYLDIKRNRMFLNEGIVRQAPLDCPDGNCVLPVSDHRFTLPIPQSEINANPSLTQNNGYGN